MRILVTGGFGYVGGRVAQYLSKLGHHVLLASRIPRASPEWLPESAQILLDWSDPDTLTSACMGVDVIVHAAGMNAKDSQANPLHAFEVNALHTGRLIEAAKDADVKRFIYFSTAHVYSSTLLGRIDEQVRTENYHPYASSHLAAEYLVLGATGIESVVLRLSNACGAPAHADVNGWMLLVNDLCRQLIVNGKMQLHSDASQLRDFIPMTDVAAAVEHMLAFPLDNNSENIFNLGGENSMRIGEMAEFVASRFEMLWGARPLIECLSSKAVFTNASLAYDLTKLKSTGFNLKQSLEQEIDQALLFCRSHFST